MCQALVLFACRPDDALHTSNEAHSSGFFQLPVAALILRPVRLIVIYRGDSYCFETHYYEL